MATKNEIDSRGRKIEDEIEAMKDAPNRGIANPDLVKTIGRHWHSKRRFSWGTRYHAEGDMSAKTFDDGSRFEPVRQFVD